MDAASSLALGFGALICLIAFSAMVLCAAVPVLPADDPDGFSDEEIAEMRALNIHDGEGR